MLKSFKLLMLVLLLVGSFLLGPVTTVRALTYPAEINKSFTPISITSGGTSRLRVTIYNPNANALTSAGWLDNLVGVQPGLRIANPPNVVQTCSGTVTDGGGGTVDPGDTSIRLTGGTVPGELNSNPGSCYVELSVTSTTPGNLINTIPASALTSFTVDPLDTNIPPVQVPITNTTPASATLNVVVVQPPSVSKGFAPNTMFVGEISELTITIRNNDLNAALTNTTFTDTLPVNVVVATPLNATLTGCGAGTLSSTLGGPALAAGDTAISLNNGTIARNSNCVITVDVTSVRSAAYNNTIPAGPPGSGSVQTQQGVTNAAPASAPLNVQAFNLSKSFSPSPIAVGGVSQLTITIQNPANFSYTGVIIPDNLPTGLVIAGPVNTATTGCGTPTFTDSSGGTLDAGDASVRMNGGSIAPLTTCTITVDVTAPMNTAAGTYTNTILTSAMQTDQLNSNHLPASANLAVQSVSINKAFWLTTEPAPSANPAAVTFAAGQTSNVTIWLNNPSPNDFTVVSVSDTLPTTPNTNLFFTGTPTTTCVGGAVAFTGAPPLRTVTLTGGTIPAGTIASPGRCKIVAQVTTLANAPAANNYDNTIPINSLVTVEGGTHPVASNTARVSVSTVSVDKAFQTNPVSYPNTSRLQFTITNPNNGGALTGIRLVDNLAAGLIFDTTIAPVSTCGAGYTFTDGGGGPFATGDTSMIFNGGTLGAAPSTCTVTVYVQPTQNASSGGYDNVLGPGVLTTDQGPTNSSNVTRTLTVNAVSVSKAFQFSSFQAGGTNNLTITLTNSTSQALTVNTVSDTLPTNPNSNLEFTGTPTTTCVGGVVSLSGAPTRTVALSGGTIPANATCTITATVTTALIAPAAVYTGVNANTIPVGALTTTQGPSNTSAATAPVSVYAQQTGVTAAKSFNPSTINVGQNSRVRLTFTAPPDTNLTNFSFTDDLQTALTGMTVSNSSPPSATGCGTLGGAWPPANGATTISASGGTIAAGGTCTVDVYVTSNYGTGTGIAHRNTIRPIDISNTEQRTIPANVSADLTVRTVSTLSAIKAFYPPIINSGGLSTLTITLTNTGSSPLVNLTVTDNLPAQVVVAPNPNASTTCGAGTLTDGSGGPLDAGDTSVRLNGGTITEQLGIASICTINLDVRGLTNGTRTNTIPTTNVIGTIQGTSSTMNAQADATAQLIVQNLTIEIVKGFVPQLVYGGAVSTLNIELRNPNTAAVLTGITFIDNMPANMIIADPPLFNPSAVGDCGPGATITGTPGTSTFTFSGGTLDAGEECTLSLSVTMLVNGNLTNTIPAGAVTTFNGVSNGTPTSASLTNLAGASVSKSFAPNPVASGLGSYSILTITIRSTANVALTNLGLVDSLPVGLQVAGGSAPAPTTTCISGVLEDGTGNSLTPGDTTIQLVGAAMPIGFSSCIITVPVTGANPGVYTNDIPSGRITNTQLISNQSPAQATLTLTPYSLGNRVWYDTNNNGLVDSGESGIPNVRVELFRDNGTTPGVFDAGDTFVGFETTNGTGYYRFDNLGADNYVVVIPDDNFRDVTGDTVPANPLQGYLSSGSTLSGSTITDGFSPDPDNPGSVDNDDNGGSTFTGLSLNYVAAQAVTLGSGSIEPTGEADPAPNPGANEAVDNQSDRTVDFGFYRLELGNQIFNDLNNDGIFDGGDTPLPGATVQLYASNGTTEINVGPDGILGTSDDATGGVITSAGGTYLFSGLPAGSYIVRVTPPSGYSTTDAGNLADSTDPNNNIDNNDNGIGIGTGQVSSNVVTLTPGVAGASTTVDTVTATTSNPSVDFGFVPLYSLGNRVWFDTNNNSVIDGSEAGINNVRVELYLDNGDGVYGPGDSSVGFDTTDANGYYRFDYLNPGNYVVVIPTNQFASGGQLENYWSSGTSATNSGVISDSTTIDPDTGDVDSDDNGITAFTGNNINYVSSLAVTLGPGLSEPINDNDPTTNPEPGEAPNEQSNRTVDFGFYQLELGNQIFWDIDSNGSYGAGDLALDGATVRLFTGDGLTELDSVTTDVSGQYLFTGMPAGDYVIRVTTPTGFASTSDSADTTVPNNNTDNNDNGVGIGTGEVSSNPFAMTPGDTGVSNIVTDSTGTTLNPSLDFGFVPDSSFEFSLGNRVWFDTDNNGAINGSEVGVNDVRVELYQDNGTLSGVYDAGDTFLEFDTTDPGGYYRFDNLSAGQYVVVIPATQFSAGGPLDGYLSSGTVISNIGTITDGIGPDPDVTATDSDDNGRSTFAGSTLSFVVSQAVTLGPSAAEPIGETDSLPNPDVGEEPDDQSNRTVDFGFYRLQLSNQIFVDVDNDGVYNTVNGDLPLAGAQVQLFTGDGLVEIRVGPDGILATPDDTLGGVTTGLDGQYLFSGLPTGDYIVRVIPPSGYTSTADINPDTTTPNNNVNHNDNGIGVNVGQVSSNPVSLVPGVTGASTTVTNSTGTTSNPSMDFGFTPTNGFLKTIAGTNETFTTGANVAIGEIVTYQITVDLIAGTPLNNVVVTDSMDRGLAFVDCDSVVRDGADITSSVCPPTVSSVGDPADFVNAGRQVVFNIGNILAPVADSTLVIRYNVIVLDILENQQGTTLNNNAVVTWLGGSFSSSAPNVRIVEPDLTIDKSAIPSNGVAIGTPIQFSLTINHTAISSVDAFDVVVTDILPPELEYISCSVNYTGLIPTTPVPPAYCPGTTSNLIFQWDAFPLGATATITFNARLVNTPAANTANVAWTSLPIDPQLNGLPVQLSTHNVESTERWYDPLDDVNVYAVFDTVTINAASGGPSVDETDMDLPNILPKTGFAPNRVIIVPDQPREKAYRATDIWLEVPRLGLKMPIVGVPLAEDDWNLTWLWDEAGWLEGTAFPTWQGNSVLTGHVTLPNGEVGPFASLGKLKWGDRVIVHAYGTAYTYEVRQNRTVSPSNTSVLKHEEESWVTLLTCKTYNESTDTYSSRIAVRAVLISTAKDKTNSATNVR